MNFSTGSRVMPYARTQSEYRRTSLFSERPVQDIYNVIREIRNLAKMHIMHSPNEIFPCKQM